MIPEAVIKEARKRSEDPAQEQLRGSKESWNDEASVLIAQIIAFKRGLNGRGDPRIGIPPSSIKDPLPDEVSQYLNSLADRYQSLISGATIIISLQKDYASNRRKGKSERTQALAAATGNLEKTGAWAGSRLWAALRYPIFKTNELTKLRISLLYSLSDYEKKTYDIENILTKSHDNAGSAAFYAFTGLVELFKNRFPDRFDELLKEQLKYSYLAQNSSIALLLMEAFLF